MFLFGEPMKMIAVAQDSGSFFAGYSLFVNEEKFPAPAATYSSSEPSAGENIDILTRMFFARLIDQETPVAGQTIRIRALVDPIGQAINLVNADITYSTSTLRLVGIDSEVSDFSLNLIKDSRAGAVSVIAMQPWPGVASGSIVVDLVFLALKAGPAEIDFAPSSTAFANDGQGTEVVTSAEPANFIII
jgi:hypothetical protein